MPAVNSGIVVDNEHSKLPVSPPARVQKRMDLEVHALRGFKLPNRHCLLVLAFIEHLKNPLPTSRVDLRALKIRCKVEEEDDRGQEK